MSTTTSKPPWAAILRPTPPNDQPGVRVVLQGPSFEREVARVGFDRPETKDPEQTFESKLQDWLARAQLAVQLINELNDTAQAAIDAAEKEKQAAIDAADERAKQRLLAILGPTPDWSEKLD